MTSAAIRNALLTWPRATLTDMPSLSLVSWLCCLLRRRLTWRDLGGLLVGGPQFGGQPGEFRLEAAARVGTGQTADLHRGAVLGRRTGAGADEDSPTADHEREQQPAQGGDAADQGGQLARVVRDGQAHPGDVAGERDRAPAVRKLQ